MSDEPVIRDLGALEPIIERAQVCRVGFSLDDKPYVVPMNFGYRDGRVYLHSSAIGRKIDILKQNPSVCFEVDIDHALEESEYACLWGMRFRSVIGFGRAALVDDPGEKAEALDIIMDHYSSSAPHDYADEMLDAVAVIRIDLEEVSGRVHGYDP